MPDDTLLTRAYVQLTARQQRLVHLYAVGQCVAWLLIVAGVLICMLVVPHL